MGPTTSFPLLAGSMQHGFLGQVDPLVQLMKVEKTPDSTYEMIGGVDKQIKDSVAQRRPLDLWIFGFLLLSGKPTSRDTGGTRNTGGLT